MNNCKGRAGWPGPSKTKTSYRMPSPSGLRGRVHGPIPPQRPSTNLTGGCPSKLRLGLDGPPSRVNRSACQPTAEKLSIGKSYTIGLNYLHLMRI
jgi:hypothetical protein